MTFLVAALDRNTRALEQLTQFAMLVASTCDLDMTRLEDEFLALKTRRRERGLRSAFTAGNLFDSCHGRERMPLRAPA